MGAYFKVALDTSILKCGLADKNTVKNLPNYPEMPYSQEDEEENIEAQRQLIIAKMNKWTRINNSARKKK